MTIEFQKILGIEFKRPELLQAALTHKSFYFESKEKNEDKHFTHNEKLEFLGDAVLDLVLSEYLMELFPDDSEGELSKKRASLVNEAVLARVAQDMSIAKFLSLGKGEMMSGGEKKPRLLASAFEAIVGAYFIDQGYLVARKLVRNLFAAVLTEMNTAEDFQTDYKTRLQEVIQSEKRTSPTYKVIQEIGPAHDREFHVHLYVQDALLAEGRGRSKKQAEQSAASHALQLLKNQGRIT